MAKKITLPTNASKPKSAMAQLLAKHKDSVVTLKKGEDVSGIITKLTGNEILVNIGAKTDAIVLEKEKSMLDTLFALFTVGDKVTVSVLNPEADNGHPIVSLRRYVAHLAWKKLESLVKSKEQIDTTVQDVTKAGYVLLTDFGVSGFLPQSHVSFIQQNDLTAGATVSVTVQEANKKENKIIFSQKVTLSDDDFKKAEKEVKEGDKVTATITNISSFGIFTSFSTKKGIALEGFIHISEVSWDKVSNLASLYHAGQEIETVVLKWDKDAKRVNLSIKRLTTDPFEALMETYPVEKKVKATIVSIDDSGVTLSLDPEHEGFIKQEKIPPTSKYTVGQEITASVSEYDKKRKRIILVPVLLEKPIGYR